MRKRRMTTLLIVASLLISAQALAQSRPPMIPNFQRGQVLTADELNRIVGQVNTNTSALSGGDGETHVVDCGAGETIADAVSQAQPGDTIMIAAGTCNENVVVNKDGITLAGADQNETFINGGGDVDKSVILVRGQQNVTIKDLTVQNGLIGIHVALGASAWLENVTAKGSRSKAGHNSGFGILIANSSGAVLTGSVVATGNASHGLIAWQGGRVSVVGNVVFEGSRMPQAELMANNNRGNGIQVGVSSSLQVQAADGPYTTVWANGNDGHGIILEHGSSARFGGGASITAANNGSNGLAVTGGSTATFAGWPDSSLGFTGVFNENASFGMSVGGNSYLAAHDNGVAANSITAKDNVYGVILWSASTALFESPSSETSSKLVLDSNYIGAGVYSASSLLLRMPTEIKDNTNNGIDAWGNGWVESGTVVGTETTITGNEGNGINAWNGVGLYLANATVTGNTGVSVSAGQGSRLDWSGGQVDDPVNCDGTVLDFNDASCPVDDDEGDESNQ